jgi:hypothetical protein
MRIAPVPGQYRSCSLWASPWACPPNGR